MARNKKVEILSHDGQVLHPITDGDCVIFPDGETLTHKLSEDEAVMYTPEVVNSSPMFKVGEGDTSDYSASVLDGAYQEAILKGQTYVNTIQEPSADEITLPTPFTEYERTQSKTFTEMNSGTFGINLVGQSYVNSIQEPSKENYVALGEALEFQNKKVEYTNNGQIKSATLKGQTLVNVDSYYKSDNISQYFYAQNIDSISNDGYIQLTANGTWRNAHTKFNGMLKPNTRYLFVVDIKTNTLADGTQPFRMLTDGTDSNGNHNAAFEGQALIINHGQTGLVKHIVTTKTDFSNTIVNSRNYISNTVTSGKIVYRTMLIEYQEGMENWDIPFFRGMQSVTMSTELENVCSRYNSSAAKNGKTFTTGSWENRNLYLAKTDDIAKYNFKPNTKYLMQFKITNLNLDGLSSLDIAFSDSTVATGNSLFGDNATVTIKSNGIYRGVFTTSNVISTSNFVIKGLKTQWEDTTSTTRKLTISQIMCIEYQNGMENWDLPYFETTQLMKPLKVQSINKNLFDTANMFSSYKTTISEVTTNSFRLTGTDSNGTYKNTQFLFDVKPNTDYKVTFKSEATDGDSLCDVYDANAKYLGSRNFNSGNNTKVSVRFYVNMNNTKNGTVKYYDVQMEESLTETPYAPHQSKTTSALEPITLRAIGDVKDTLDLSTGEYVQRIGEIVLDGSDDEGWKMNTNSEVNACRFDTTILSGKIPLVSNTSLANILCDKYKTTTFSHTYVNASQGIAIFSNTHIVINNGMTNLDDFKLSLQNNPIKVQYELANPITRKISLGYPNLQTYQDITHVQSIAMDGTLIPKIFLPSDISYKAMLKPNTSYNVIVDREVIDSTNQLTVNLGGTTANITANRTVVTTPSTLSNETLTFSGKDNRLAKAMLIEGSTLINGDLPHFDGIGDVKLGRVVENLCMANHITVGGATSTDTLYSDKITSKITRTGSKVHIFQLTKNLENGKRYFIYCPYDYQYIIYGFRHEYNNSLSYSYQSCEGVNKKYAIIRMDGNQQKNPYTHLTVGCHGNIAVDTTMTIRRPIICEYIDGMENWDWESIGYFTGIRNVGNEFMRIENKNLFDGVLENGMIDTQGNLSLGGVSKRTANFIKVKSNTSYTLSCDNGYNYIYIHEYDKNYQHIKEKNIATSNTFTTEQNTMYIKFNSHAINELQANTKIQLEEASTATSYVAHKHNTLYIPQDESISLSFTQGGIFYNKGEAWTNATNNTNTARIRTQLFDLEPNETYRVSCGSEGYNFAVYSYDNSLVGTSDTSWLSGEYYINTTKDIHKIGIAVKRTDDANLTPSVLHQVRLEKVTDVHLRSAGDVCDELDLTRGVYVQRMHEVTLDGTGIISLNSPYSTDNTICFDFYYNAKGKIYEQSSTGGLICDKLIPKNWLHFYGSKTDEEGIVLNRDNGNTLLIKIAKSKLETEDVSGLKTYLASKPITVQYPLETPIEHKIHIPMKNESNQTIAKPNGIFTLPLMHSGNNHVDINSQIYPKVQSRDYIAYPVIASPSQQYTVFHSNIGSNLTVNLCGASTTVNAHKNTITTPSSISQYELRLSGATNKVSNVCVFNGDYMNVNVPYVQGMMNAVNPIVKNTGKNLISFDNLYSGYVTKGALSIDKANQTITGTNDYNDIQFYVYLIQGKAYTFKANGTFSQNQPLQILRGKRQGYHEGYLVNTFINNRTFTHGMETGWYSIHVVHVRSMYNIQLEETLTLSQYEPYKENNCKPENGQVYLTQDMFEQGSMSGVNGAEYDKGTSNARIRTKELIKIKPSTKYIFRMNDNYSVWIKEFNTEGKQSTASIVTWLNNGTFTTKENTEYISFIIKKGTNNPSISVSEFNNINPYLCELDKEIHLRSLPNGVRDELNLETGEYIQRVGEITFDGGETGWDGNAANNNTFRIKCDVAFINNTTIHAICKEYEPRDYTSSWDTGKFISVSKDKKITFRDDNFSQGDTASWKAYLQTNPITVQYQLATPIVKHVDIHNYPHSYKDGHVIIENGDPTTPVPAQLTYKCVTNRSGQIQEHTEQVEKQERQINELETLVLENIRMNQNRSQNFLASLISTLEIEEE